MDLQHTRLRMLVDDLDIAEESGTPRTDIVEAVFDLLRDVGTHFTEEEVLMDAYGYPDLPEHRAAHDGFSMALAATVSEFLMDRDASVEQLTRWFRAWFENHVRVDDTALAEYLQIARTRPRSSTPQRRRY